MASIRYIAIGKVLPKVAIAYSRNGGKSWQETILGAGQTFHVPPNCSNLTIDSVPYDPKVNYDVRGGKVAQR